MTVCARCSVDIGEGGVTQADGKRMCGACDLRVNGPSLSPGPSVGPPMPTFCPKCSTVWDRTSTSCPKCNWDVIAQRHIIQQVKKKHYRIAVEPASIALTVIILVGGYLCYDYYQTQKADSRKEAARLARQEIEQKEAAEQARKDDEEQAKKRAEENAKLQRERAEAQRVAEEKTRLRYEKEKAERKAEQEAERKQRLDDEKRQRDDFDRKVQQEADAERQRAADERQHALADAVTTRDQKIAQLTQDLKAATEAIRTAQAAKEAAQPQLAAFRNRSDFVQKQIQSVNQSMYSLMNTMPLPEREKKYLRENKADAWGT